MQKAIAFMIFVWLFVIIAGGIVQGSSVIGATRLTADIDEDDDVIPVVSTEGFADAGFVQILDERIRYSSKTDTTFKGTILVQPLVRGAEGTDAAAHTTGEIARTVESFMLNSSMGYKLAVLSDSSGILAFVTIPFAFISLLATFLVLPLSWLGSDLQIFTYVWGVLSISIIVAIAIALAGGRRV